MFESARESIYKAIASIRLVDPHTHINPHAPASTTLADILGYHYYTELVHSSGMPKSEIEEDGIEPRELVRRLVRGLPNIENTANYQWLISICQTFFDFQDDRITESNWESLYDAAEEKMSYAQWPQMVLDKSNVESVFLTNDFDDPLEGFDTNTYIPCLRTDDLVFHLGKHQTRERLAACTGIELDGSLESLRSSLRNRFEHFVPNGARACAISIPPDFEPIRVADGRAATALNEVLRKGNQADASHHVALSRRVFWTLAELCDEFNVPFDLMIGVNRGVYPEGVYQGQDLYDSRVSLVQYRELFNAFPDVKFPVSVLASVTNQELVSYAWIFPNVITNGHWWYSNTPSFIARDAAARLEAVPKNKQIGYYSDAYKLEFVWAKFDMYRQILADILAQHFVGSCGWSEERAVELGYQVLRGNVDTIFPNRDDPSGENIPSFDARTALALTSATAAGLAGTELAGVSESEVEAETLAETVDSVEVMDEQVTDQPEPEEEVALDEISEPEQEQEPEPESAEIEELVSDEDEPEESSGLFGVPGAVAGAGAALAAGAIGLVEVGEAAEPEDDADDIGIGEEAVDSESDAASLFLNDETVEDEEDEYEEEGELDSEAVETQYEDEVEVEDEIEVEDEDVDHEEEYEEVEAASEYEEEDEIEVEEEDDLDEESETYEDVEEDVEGEYEEDEVAEVEDEQEYEDELEEVAGETEEYEYEEVGEDDEEELEEEDAEGETEYEEVAEVEHDGEVEEFEEDEEEYEDVEEVDLDPLPTDEEIQGVDVDDVELGGFGAGILDKVDTDKLDLDPEPLDVGNLLDDEIQSVADEIEDSTSENKIRMLRGEESFTPDEDSLQLNKNPLTGELTFGGAPSLSDVADKLGVGEVPDDPIDELESMIQETVELDESGGILGTDNDEIDFGDLE